MSVIKEIEECIREAHRQVSIAIGMVIRNRENYKPNTTKRLWWDTLYYSLKNIEAAITSSKVLIDHMKSKFSSRKRE